MPYLGLYVKVTALNIILSQCIHFPINDLSLSIKVQKKRHIIGKRRKKSVHISNSLS